MAYVPSAVAPRDLIVESPAGTRPGFFRRFLDVMMLARQRQADREIARYLQNRKFTDEAEREIERLFLSTPTRF
ncbi:MAG TPA: hypothetical protein VGI09_06415 [Pseudolabrys sp.]|jgi:hypothetical protein